MDGCAGWIWMVCLGKDARDAAPFGRPLDHKSISCQLNWNALLVARSSKEEQCFPQLERHRHRDSHRHRDTETRRSCIAWHINFITCLFMANYPNWVSIDNGRSCRSKGTEERNTGN